MDSHQLSVALSGQTVYGSSTSCYFNAFLESVGSMIVVPLGATPANDATGFSYLSSGVVEGHFALRPWGNLAPSTSEVNQRKTSQQQGPLKRR